MKLVTGDLVLLGTDHTTVDLTSVGGVLYVNGAPVDPSDFPDHKGAGSPEGHQVGAVGQSYVDTTNGALYFKASGLGNTGWTGAAANVGSGSPSVAGAFTFGVDVVPSSTVLAASSAVAFGGAGAQVWITDIDAINGSGNGIYYIVGAADGDQALQLSLGPGGGGLTWNWNADGSTTFPGHITVTGDAAPTNIDGAAGGVALNGNAGGAKVHGDTGGVTIDDAGALGITIQGNGTGGITLFATPAAGGITISNQGSGFLALDSAAGVIFQDTSAAGIAITELGAGAITISGDNGVTVETSAGGLVLSNSGAGDIDLIQVGTGDINIHVAAGHNIAIGQVDTELIGFYGVAPIVQPVLATGAGHTADDIITYLQHVGLVRQA